MIWYANPFMNIQCYFHAICNKQTPNGRRTLNVPLAKHVCGEFQPSSIQQIPAYLLWNNSPVFSSTTRRRREGS